jgi:hypothetical protein
VSEKQVKRARRGRVVRFVIYDEVTTIDWGGELARIQAIHGPQILSAGPLADDITSWLADKRKDTA